ncbi:MAG: hypothetical protein LQ350_005787 [Teloschistes chrysophthalmus]|nr:MAG: hypothetical protein LQ350_005787 [Niorma chrysophthalma]
MPVFTRRQNMMAHTPRSSTDSSSSQDHICIYHEDFERPQKEMDFPSVRLNSKMPRNELRINTYSKSDLPERYMSSEEEPSPSPDSSDAESTCSDELKHKPSARVLAHEEAPIDLAAFEADVTTEIAVAMPIVACGRPKLIDISSLAPMQKRKRVIKQPIAPSSKHTLVRRISNISSLTADNNPFAANEAAEVIVPADRTLIIAQKQAAMAASRRLKEQQQQLQQQQVSRQRLSSAPVSWFPEEEEYHTADEERDESFSAAPNNSYDIYEPFPTIAEETTPRSSPSRLSTQSMASTTRKRNNSNPFSPATLGKGMARTWSIATKKVHHGSFSSSSSSQITAIYSPQPQQQHQLREKSSFSSFHQHPERKIERQLSKKPKMVARGANEREDNLVLPPCPFEEPIAV